MKEKKPNYDKHINKIEKQEQKLLNQKEKNILQVKLDPVTQKISQKIPPKLKAALMGAFYKAFVLVFAKGSEAIEKTYNKDKIKKEYAVNNYAIDMLGPKKRLKNMDRQARNSRRLNMTLTTLEGAGLGFLGLGLPDIPLFIAMLLKNLYETALSYGFDYEKEEEKIYLLMLINGAILKGDRKRLYDARLEQTAAYIQWQLPLQVSLDDLMKETSENLAEIMLLGKYIQGLPLVGVSGGILNFNIMNKISRYARLKYKKRYLLNKC